MSLKLSVAVTFLYREDRLIFLRRQASALKDINENIKVFVVTQNLPLHGKKILEKIYEGISLEIVIPNLLGHPFLLTWVHLEVLRRNFIEDTRVSHFIYLEDDILFSKNNLSYWIEGRERLRHLSLVPSFIRWETKEDEKLMMSTDLTKRYLFNDLPRAHISNSYCFVNFPEPYQGMYVLDRELAKEHYFSYSSNPDFGKWGIREKAAQGITFKDPPAGCYSRNFAGFRTDKMTFDDFALVHHMPNNYANDPHSPHGKQPLDKVVY